MYQEKIQIDHIKKIPLWFDKILFFFLAIVLFLPTESIVIVFVFSIALFRFLLILPFIQKINFNESILIILFIFLSINSLYYVIEGGSVLPYITFGLTAGYLALFIFCVRYTKFEGLKFFYKIFKFLTIIQLPYIFVIAVMHNFKRGDWYGGSTGNSHYYGLFIMIILLEELINLNKQKKKFIIHLTYIFILFGTIWLCDINAFMFFFVISVGITFFLLNKKKIGWLFVIVFLIGIFLNLFFSHFGILFKKDNYKAIPKVAGFYTIEKLYKDDPLKLFFGTSVGTYSSRASVALSSPNILAKPKGKSLPITHTSKYIYSYFSELYSPSYYIGLEKAGVTGTFYTPFSTALTLIGEFGLIGISFVLLLILSTTWNLLKLSKLNKKKAFWGMSLLLGITGSFVYDNFMEYSVMITPIILIVSKISNEHYNNKEQYSQFS